MPETLDDRGAEGGLERQGGGASMRAQRPPYLAYTCLAASMMLVGTYVGASRLLVAALPVFLLAWLRFGIAALFAVAREHLRDRGRPDRGRSIELAKALLLVPGRRIHQG